MKCLFVQKKQAVLQHLLHFFYSKCLFPRLHNPVLKLFWNTTGELEGYHFMASTCILLLLQGIKGCIEFHTKLWVKKNVMALCVLFW